MSNYKTLRRKHREKNFKLGKDFLNIFLLLCPTQDWIPRIYDYSYNLRIRRQTTQ